MFIKIKKKEKSSHHFDEFEELDDGRVQEVISRPVVQ